MEYVNYLYGITMQEYGISKLVSVKLEDIKEWGIEMRNKKGFTLIELLAVIAILGIVLGIAAFTVTNVLNRSKTDVAEVDKGMIRKAAELYVNENV